MKDNRPFCPYSFATAREFENVIAWKESQSANIDCSNAIDDIINNNFDGNRLAKDLPKEIIAKYGKARVCFVIANTILLKKDDIRISKENKEWAGKLNYIFDENTRYDFELSSHSGFVDMFARQYRDGEKQVEKKAKDRGRGDR